MRAGWRRRYADLPWPGRPARGSVTLSSASRRSHGSRAMANSAAQAGYSGERGTGRARGPSDRRYAAPRWRSRRMDAVLLHPHDIGVPSRSAHHPGITPGGVIRGSVLSAQPEDRARVLDATMASVPRAVTIGAQVMLARCAGPVWVPTRPPRDASQHRRLTRSHHAGWRSCGNSGSTRCGNCSQASPQPQRIFKPPRGFWRLQTRRGGLQSRTWPFRQGRAGCV